MEEENVEKSGRWRDRMYQRFGLVGDPDDPDGGAAREDKNRLTELFNRNVNGSSPYSWGLVFLLVVAAYAAFQLIRAVVYIF